MSGKDVEVGIAAHQSLVGGSRRNEYGTFQGNLRQTVVDALEEKGDRGLWLWTLFILCLTPNILNGFHVSSYVFLGQLPENYYCVVPNLLQSGWTHDEIRNISTNSGIAKNGTCTILNWDYNRLAGMNYRDAQQYLSGQPKPSEVSCLGSPGFELYYEQKPGYSIVPEWDLICERTALRSTVQVALSMGKFVGASTFGVLSDKYGRKSSFTIAATLYVVASLLTTFSPFYILLLLGRIGLGASASGVFYPAFALLTENIGNRHRSWMSIAFNFSYPIGMLILALAAYLIQPWRDLSLALTIPSFLLVIHLYFLVESPRWLLSKGRERRAYRMVFGRKAPQELCDSEMERKPVAEEGEESSKLALGARLKRSFSEFGKLYGTPTLCRRALICHFTWCVTSLCYYVTALNADNFAANRNIYVATTGSVDIIAYILSIIALAYFGRKSTSFCFFLYAGICLLVVLAVPKESTAIVVTLAMLGRLGITAVYAVVTLHTAELFPTEIRNTALGICSTMAHVGSIAAPYIVDLLGQLAWWIPTTICGFSVLAACALTLLHPETKDAVLKDHAKQEESEPAGATERDERLEKS
ncbi:organic cation transporter protein isoform X2 [Toxorhynchites rutilus septentrionalis]|uniref:organic cation transporter protein isoform X2 n=1 Tax=Toxorhynchites rutilus septentrionalis TaxID=329112 RepID=UPI002478C2E5|nr:organic cation transporter protein isoform X2 [Toxorhynchites rutilus septentrionalis]